MKSILITDSLFIFPEHEEKLKMGGFSIERLDKPQATEEELIEALKGKEGYILGGIERVTDKVIASTDTLKVICFTGADWHYFIPGYELATKKGIAITNSPGSNTVAVAEYTLTLILAMVRDIFDLGRTGTATFRTTNSLPTSSVGIIGMGRIGEKVVRMLKGVGVSTIYYYNRTRKEDLEKELGIIYLPIEEVIQKSDIVSLHTSTQMGTGYFGEAYLKMMKDNAILINCSFVNALDFEALYPELKSGRIRCAHDGEVADARYKELPLHVWFNSNAHTAYNTKQATQLGSDMAVESIINLLNGKEDQYKVN